MADSHSIINDQVVPYSGGRMNTDTSSWREVTDLELEQQERINELESDAEDLECVIMFLDSNDVPTHEDSEELSTVGRIEAYAKMQQDAQAEHQ